MDFFFCFLLYQSISWWTGNNWEYLMKMLLYYWKGQNKENLFISGSMKPEMQIEIKKLSSCMIYILYRIWKGSIHQPQVEREHPPPALSLSQLLFYFLFPLNGAWRLDWRVIKQIDRIASSTSMTSWHQCSNALYLLFVERKEKRVRKSCNLCNRKYNIAGPGALVGGSGIYIITEILSESILFTHSRSFTPVEHHSFGI